MYSLYQLPQHKFMLKYPINITLRNIFTFLRFILKLVRSYAFKNGLLALLWYIFITYTSQQVYTAIKQTFKTNSDMLILSPGTILSQYITILCSVYWTMRKTSNTYFLTSHSHKLRIWGVTSDRKFYHT